MKMQIMVNRQLSVPRKQRGAVLITSLMLLLVMTVIGVTAMKTVIIEEKMAANKQNKVITLRASESAATDALNNLTVLQNALGGTQTHTASIGDGITATAVVSYRQATLVPGNSIKVGKGWKALHFDIDASGLHNNSNARSNTIEGAYRIAPGAP